MPLCSGLTRSSRLCLTEHMNANEKMLDMLIEREAEAQLALTLASNEYQKLLKYEVLQSLGITYNLEVWKNEVAEARRKLDAADAVREALYLLLADFYGVMADEAPKPRYEVRPVDTDVVSDGEAEMWKVWDTKAQEFVSLYGPGNTSGVTFTLFREYAQEMADVWNAFEEAQDA